MGKFELYQGNDDKYYFRLKAANGQTIATSQGYSRKESAKNGIESVKANAISWEYVADTIKQMFSTNKEAILDQFELKEGKDGKVYFNLKAKNGQVIASSQGYKSVASALNGIESVRANAPDAEVDDQTTDG